MGSIFDVELPAAPYPGLRPFEKHEWPIFFGRERMSDDIVAQLLEKQLIVIHGDSGSGKSSLVRAAVLPRLEQESASSGVRWRTCIAVPGEAPLWNVAQAFASLDVDTSEARVLALRRALNGREAAAANIAEQLACSAQDRVCILIDQFEELFAHARRHGPDEATLLTEWLVALFEKPTPGLYAVLTMRSEFLGACARFAGFAELVNATQYLLPRMNAADLRRAIMEPAQLYGGSISGELADRLVADAGGGQDQLPLIQHGLMQMYHERGAATPWRLGAEHYRDSLALLLSRHADEVMAACMRDHGVPAGVIEQIFRALIEINAEGQAIRRPQTLRALLETSGAAPMHVRAVIDAFRAEGVSFLRSSAAQALSEDDLVDVSHEALIRCWGKLANKKDGWLVCEFRDGLLWRALLVQAESFERDPADVISAAAIDDRSVWFSRRNAAWAKRYGGGWKRVQALIQSSVQARDRKRAEEKAARLRELDTQRKSTRLKVYAAAAVVLAIAAVSVTVAEQHAREAAALAEQEQFNAREAAALADREKLNAESAKLHQSRQDNEVQDDAQKRAEALRRAARQLDAAASSGRSAELKESAKQVTDLLERQANTLADPAATPAPNPRLYIQFGNDAQRAEVLALQGRLRSEREYPLTVPPIQSVHASPKHSELRCFRDDECNGAARHILGVLAELLSSPPVTLVNLSEAYKNAPGVKPNTFELWFAVGDEIRLRDTSNPPTD